MGTQMNQATKNTAVELQRKEACGKSLSPLQKPPEANLAALGTVAWVLHRP